MEWYMAVMRNYVGFEGRARRREFWMFTLVYAIGYVILALISDALALLFYLAHLIPSIAVAIRRMHDTNHSGWWILLPIVNLIFAVTEGDRGDNQFGADPKAGAAPA